MSKTIIFDIEIFNNVFLFCGRVIENRNVIVIWGHEEDFIPRLREVMQSGCQFISFNGIKFDVPVIAAAIAGNPQEKLKRIANEIIEEELQPWQVYRKYGIPELKIDHIDLIEVAPSFCSLKAYGAKLHMRWLKDLPFPHDAVITEDQLAMVQEYCINDLDTTEALFKALEEPLTLRTKMSKEYGLDLRSKSDTQMAEASFVKRLNIKSTKARVPYSISYEMPSFIEFKAQHLKDLAQRIVETEYIMNQKTGHVILPDFLGKEKVKINNGSYQLGVGGLHSTHDKGVCHVANKDYIITDIDAASYYPSIIINCNLIPKNTGQRFIDEYRAIYTRRLEAKRSGDKAISEVLKISLNGTFGKTASRWSPLYSPDLALAITLTGQLSLLSLIERLEEVGATTLSANTDGIAIGVSKDDYSEIERVVRQFSDISRFEFEYTPYRVLAIGNVNNYIAVTKDRKIKAKGLYAKQDLKKNPTAQVCSEAVGKWLAFGTPIEDTIRSSSIEGYISARSVTGGGVQGEDYLGKTVRWYMTSDKSYPPLTYATNGNKVPKTEGARALMLLPEDRKLPDDLDYNWYIKEACKIAKNLGAEKFLTPEQITLITPPPKVRKPRKAK